ncbi:MAG: SDR family NAD(P)-dependent oxidoreductase [Planctomycetota bacterium]|nr:MAG: SDR family NAD(P)-dependent oxidoreductase [Planctomycetota bacterium]
MKAESRPALVTGGSGGLGVAVVETLVQNGHPVLFSHLGQQAQAQALQDRLGAKVNFFEADSADPQAMERAVASFAPQILVCCAGISKDRVHWKQSPADFEAVLRTNLEGAWIAMQTAMPSMREAGWGRVVFLGSINGSRGKFGQTAYSASKAGLIGMARSAAREVGGFGVTVNVVEPGWIDTPMTAQVPEEFRRQALQESLTGRLGTPADVAAAVSFLCSEGARQITGQILRVDGGQWLRA